jgi:protocatechuate 3,4-dioxygenase beta subunit
MDVATGRRLRYQDEPIFDQGLAFDVESVLINRRRVLKLVGHAGIGLGLVSLAGCGPSALATLTPGASATSPGASATSPGATASPADCETIPEETNGPYPADGTNGPNVLNQSGIVRSDIRSSFGTASGTATGVPLQVSLLIEDAAKSCAPMAGAAVYVWHCDQAGRYSLYSQGATDQNYLRGVQEADSSGKVTFQSIFPACYTGRWPHVHFEVYPSLAKAIDAGNLLATSQIALPKDVCDTVYAMTGYEQSVANMTRVSLASDMVFREDGGVRQLGRVGGSFSSGYTVGLTVPV